MEKPRASLVLSLLPIGLADEIFRLASGRHAGLSGIREIRVRRGGVSTLSLEGESIRLIYKVTAEEMDGIIEGLTRGALYAHRDSIAEGFISLPRGIRAGVCGSATYDGDRLVGISDMSSLVFRIPTGECAFSEDLYEIFLAGIGRGMLIYSPPGVGKTTAIRRLAYMVGGGKDAKRVVVVDERGEFDESDYIGRQVDILRGYKKGIGVEIATRTLSPDLIIIDEIGAEDAEPLISAVKCGVPIVATAHAGDKAELLSRLALRRLFDCSVFDIVLGISCKNGEYRLSPEPI